MQDLDAVANTTNRDDLLCEFASKAELAGLFGVSVRTIERWVRLRLIGKPVRLGRRSLFHIPTIRQALTDEASRAPRRASGPRRSR